MDKQTLIQSCFDREKAIYTIKKAIEYEKAQMYKAIDTQTDNFAVYYLRLKESITNAYTYHLISDDETEALLDHLFTKDRNKFLKDFDIFRNERYLLVNKRLTNTNMEQWKDIKDFEGIYQVSNMGNVRSLDRLQRNGHFRIGQIRRPIKNKYNGMLQVMLINAQTYKLKYVHRLVAEAFIANPNNCKLVIHKDNDYMNNTAENLRWSNLQNNQIKK